MSLYLYLIVTFQHALEVLTVIVTVVILLSSLDDAFVDCYYWLREFYRWFWIRARYASLSAEALRAKPEVPIAIMVPAWQESDVIAAMLETSKTLIQYDSYRIFVGVYQNDPRTIQEVEDAVKRFSGVSMSIVPRDGPTSKADCLNVILGDILSYEERTGTHFGGIAMHDAEDVIHPYELRLFNYLLDRMDLIQLPVYSFQRSLTELVAGTYMDEFAEWHSKDLVVRESITGTVPSAGVSTCFSRRAISMLRADREGEVFSTSSLTEDYDIAFRLKKLGMREIFVRFPVRFTIETSNEISQPIRVERELPIATREFFPSDFRAAYRQRARWLLGIAFQGWSEHGWGATVGAKYFFLRDRKGLLTSPTAVLAYIVMFGLIAVEFLFSFVPPAERAPYWLLGTPTYGVLLSINIAFLINRIFQRMYFTTRIYGFGQGAMAGPRMLVSNILNFFAMLRASYVFIQHTVTGRSLVWDKTAHIYPIRKLSDAQALAVDATVPEPDRDPAAS
ncbi:glycosyl transferase family protein [Pseudolabrys taiwanensis]|uniref:Glycosyl transferase family protein n=1 Tax=Pseudolabrys taiwanensis TaxID=331696 RepID=A0A345ZZH3_9HYPH|nr:glycosyl transferase family protein [Pseudolabrys taiwanensis]AXK82320.1 glycosyl transferase family protein [Pseudolabrys taiwanensis]